mmetsp:Transcript_34933/g.112169  ORF Transcript_34933/g.112169 Transcript_34933/m.112169 type:complete len:267 (-) Transcript_34933:27-827(-)
MGGEAVAADDAAAAGGGAAAADPRLSRGRHVRAGHVVPRSSQRPSLSGAHVWHGAAALPRGVPVQPARRGAVPAAAGRKHLLPRVDVHGDHALRRRRRTLCQPEHGVARFRGDSAGHGAARSCGLEVGRDLLRALAAHLGAAARGVAPAAPRPARIAAKDRAAHVVCPDFRAGARTLALLGRSWTARRRVHGRVLHLAAASATGRKCHHAGQRHRRRQQHLDHRWRNRRGDQRLARARDLATSASAPWVYLVARSGWSGVNLTIVI